MSAARSLSDSAPARRPADQRDTRAGAFRRKPAGPAPDVEQTEPIFYVPGSSVQRLPVTPTYWVRVENPDGTSWVCDHEHPDEDSAQRCAGAVVDISSADAYVCIRCRDDRGVWSHRVNAPGYSWLMLLGPAERAAQIELFEMRQRTRGGAHYQALSDDARRLADRIRYLPESDVWDLARWLTAFQQAEEDRLRRQVELLHRKATERAGRQEARPVPGEAVSLQAHFDGPAG